ncbi:hypothetical protein HKD37_05G012540 [Glycine soja]
MNHFFRKVPGRGFPGVFRKKCSSGRRFGYFQKNTSSGNFPKNVLPEEPLTGLPEGSAVNLLSPFFSASSPLVFYPKVTILRETNLVRGAEEDEVRACLAEKKKQFAEKGEEAVRGEGEEASRKE